MIGTDNLPRARVTVDALPVPVDDAIIGVLARLSHRDWHWEVVQR